MARMPGAIWKPLAADWDEQPLMRAYDFFCVHTMVGSLVGTDGYFRVGNGAGYGGTESHFGVGPDGTIYQWQDTTFQADANYLGNWHVISSENADTGAPFPSWTGSNVPALTPQQVEANARIAVWLYHTHGIPLGIAGSSKPGARGLAVHRYGVPGYMPSGAEQWSLSTGKACPGDRRIAQLPAISTRAKQLISGTTTPTPQEDDMPTPDDIFNADIFTDNPGTPSARKITYRVALNDVREGVRFLNAQVAGLQASQAELVRTITQLAQGDDLDADALVARIGETVSSRVEQALREKTVQVEVSLADGDDDETVTAPAVG